MNDMTLPLTRADNQEFFTAAELSSIAARFQYRAFPHSERGARMYAARSGWNDLEESHCRKRVGKVGGGGMEYHISLEPRLQGMLLRERLLKAETDNRNAVAVQAGANLPAKQEKRPSDTAEARGAIIIAIIGHAARTGRKRSQGIADFIKAQDQHVQWRVACQKRDRGEFLTDAELHMLDMGSPMERQNSDKLKNDLNAKSRDFILAFGVSEDVLEQANNRPRKGEFVRVGRSVLYEWLKAYEEKGYSGLAPATTKAPVAVPEDFWRFMRFYARPAKPAIVRAHAKYVADTPANWMPLSIHQVKYALKEKLDHIEQNKGREGALTLRSRMAFVSRDTSDLVPTTIYVGDGHTFDAEIADPVSGGPMRPEITAIIDAATRKLVGWAISRKENVIAVTEAMRNASIENGICAAFYVDNGSGYKNKRFDDDGNGLMSRLSITKMHALPYGSQAKGNIERSHRTIWITLAKELPTYLGADMDKEARQAAFKRSRRQLKEFGSSQLLMPWDEFRSAVAQRAAEYNDEPHSALPRIVDMATGKRRHMTPNEAWTMHVDQGFEPVKVDPDMMDDLFRPYEKRKVSRCLIQWNTNEYFHLDLNPYHQEWVFVGYDDNQADKVWVREVDRETDEPGKLICIAVYGGNRVDYMPRTVLDKAIDNRQRGALKRLEAKRRDVEAERAAPYLIEQTVEHPADFINVTPAVPEPVLVELADVRKIGTPQGPRRRTFASDEELAAWAVQHPDELNANQIAVLRRCMKDSTARKLFELSGIDMEALRTLLRAVA